MIRILPNTSAKISTFSYICKFFLLFFEYLPKYSYLCNRTPPRCPGAGGGGTLMEIKSSVMPFIQVGISKK